MSLKEWPETVAQHTTKAQPFKSVKMLKRIFQLSQVKLLRYIKRFFQLLMYSNEKDLNKIERPHQVFKTFQQQFLVKISASKQILLGTIYSLLKTYTREIQEKILDRAYSPLVKCLGYMTEK